MKHFVFLVWIITALTTAGLASPLQAQQQRAIEIVINELRYDLGEKAYFMGVAISDPYEVAYLIVNVKDEDAGLVVDGVGGEVPVEGNATLNVRLDARPLKSGHKYLIRVQALDPQNIAIRRLDDNIPASEAVILTSWTFKHDPPPAPELSVKVRSLSPDWDANTLLVNLDVQTPGDVVIKYEAAVSRAGQLVKQWGPSLYGEPQLRLDLPPEMQLPEPRQYKLGVTLTASGIPPASTEFEFTLDAAPQPSFWDQLWKFITENKVVLGICVVAATFILVWFTLGGKSKKKKGANTLTPPEPHRTGTNDLTPQASVLVRVLSSPESVNWTQRRMSLPCIIGRSGCDLVLPDPKVSKAHVRIDLRNRQFMLTDLSRNGTWLDGQKLDPNVPERLPDAATSCVRLGPETELALTPELRDVRY